MHVNILNVICKQFVSIRNKLVVASDLLSSTSGQNVHIDGGDRHKMDYDLKICFGVLLGQNEQSENGLWEILMCIFHYFQTCLEQTHTRLI